MLGFLVWSCLGAKEAFEKGRTASLWSTTEGFLTASHPGCIAGAVQGICTPFCLPLTPLGVSEELCVRDFNFCLFSRVGRLEDSEFKPG